MTAGIGRAATTTGSAPPTGDGREVGGAPSGAAQFDRRRFLAVIVVAGIGLGMTAPLTVLYAGGFGASDTMAGLAVSSVAVSLLAVDVFGTQLVPRIDGRRIVWLAMTVFGMGSLASAAAPSLGFMIGARMVQGVGAALFMGGALQVVVRFAPPSQAGQAIGAFNAAWFTGVAVGPVVGGAVASRVGGQDGYRLAFVLCGLVCLLVAAWARLVLPPIPSGATPRLSLPRLARSREGWRLPVPLGLAAFGQAVRGGLVFTIIPLLGERDLRLDTATVGLALSVLAAVDVIAMRVGGGWADRAGRRPVLVTGLAVGAAACALGPVIGGSFSFGVWCAVVAIPVAITWVVPVAVVVDVVESREAALSTYRMAADVGQLAGSTGAGAVVGAWGSGGALWVAAGAFAAVAVVAARQPETGAPVRPGPA